MKKYLVTGATGYLGYEIVSQLYKLGKKIRILVMKDECTKIFKDMDIEIIIGDITDKSSLNDFFRGDNLYLIHCAGMISIKNIYDPLIYDVNVRGTRNILYMADKSKIKRLLYVSSVHALPDNKKSYCKFENFDFDYEKIVGIYGKTKAIASKMVYEQIRKGKDCIIVHPTGIIGPSVVGSGQITPMIKMFLKGRIPFTMDGGHDFVDIRDVSRGIILAMEKGVSGENYILSGEYIMMKDLIKLISEHTNIKCPNIHLKKSFMEKAAPIVEYLYKDKKAPLTKYMVYAVNSLSFYSNRKAVKELGFKTRSIKESVKDLMEDIYENSSYS